MNKNFAKSLSEVLDGMSWNQALEVIKGLTENPITILSAICGLEEVENYPIRFEIHLDVLDKWERMLKYNFINLLEKYGIETIYYRIEINPTEAEMLDFLEDFVEEIDKTDLICETTRRIEKLFWDFNFEKVLSYFEDVRTVWDVLVDDEDHFYRADNAELMNYQSMERIIRTTTGKIIGFEKEYEGNVSTYDMGRKRCRHLPQFHIRKW